MKEELQGKLVEILTSIQTAAGKASDFAMEQLPEIAQSYLVYGRAWLTFVVVAMVVFVLSSAVVAWRAEKAVNDINRGFPTFIASIASVVPMIVLFSKLDDAFLVWFAPKVWLLKEIATLIK